MINPATKDHIPQLIKMMEEAHAEAGFNVEREVAEKAFRKLLDHPRLGRAWITFSCEQPVGYVVLTYRFSMESGGVDGHIEDIFVRENERRNGVGSKLLEKAIKQSQEDGLNAIHVETGSDDLRAIEFYRKQNLLNRGRTFLTVELLTNELAKPN